MKTTAKSISREEQMQVKIFLFVLFGIVIFDIIVYGITTNI